MSCECAIAETSSSAWRQPSEVSSDTSVLIEEASHRFHVPARWILEIMQVESGARATVASPKGAIGLMQVMPRTYETMATRYGLGADPWNRRDNVLAGAAYLREMYDRYGATGMLAAYNAGPGRWEDHLTRARPLPDETVRYIARLGPLVGDSVASKPTFDSHAVRPMPVTAPIFAMLGGGTMPSETAGRQEQVARIIVANATVTGNPDALFMRRSLDTDAPSDKSEPNQRTAETVQPVPKQSRVPAAIALSSGLLFAPQSGAGERP